MSLHRCAACTTAYAAGLEACPNCGSAERAQEETGPMLPTAVLECRTFGCRAEGVERRVVLHQVALGVLHMPRLLLCACCGLALYLVRPWTLPGVVFETTEDGMAKITRHGGPSDKNAPAPKPRQAAAEQPVEPGPVLDLSQPLTGEEAEQVEQIAAAHEGEEHRVAVLGEEEPSAGPPAPSERKDAWVAYAVAAGADPSVAKAMTKADLIKEYG